MYTAEQVSRMVEGEAFFQIFKFGKFTGNSISASSEGEAIKLYRKFSGK